MSLGGGASATNTKEDTDTDRRTTSTRRERLEISDEAIDKIMSDILSKSGSGIKDIFGGEQTAGIFNSSVSAQAAGDLAANLAGEIAKLRAESVIESDETEEEAIRRREQERTIEVSGSI